MVFLLSLLRARILEKLQSLPSQMRREDFQRRRLKDLSKRLRRTKKPMSRERIKLGLEII
jgi:predicted DNA-binding protein